MENQNLDYGTNGIQLVNSDDCTIENISSNYNNCHGISLLFSDSNKISNTSCNSNEVNGLTLTQCKSNIIKNSSFNYNKNRGIFFDASASNIIISNSLSNNYLGIELYGYGESMRMGNQYVYLNRDDDLRYSNHNIFYNNFFANNYYGIFIEVCYSNSFYNNTIFNNFFGAVLSGDEYNEPSGNRFYYNNFISNKNQMVNPFYNYWDNGEGEGNYWSDYKGQDNGAWGRVADDGVGDTFIPHLQRDYFPLMDPPEWRIPPIAPLLVDPGEVDSDGNYDLIWCETYSSIGYVLEEDTNSTFNSPTIVFNGSNLSFEIKDRANGTYFYHVKAYSKVGESPWSNIVDITVDWPPNIPRNLTVSTYPYGNVLNLSWERNVEDTNAYDIYSNYTGNWSIIVTMSGWCSTYNHTDLIDGKTYYYRIRARDQRNQLSELSEIVSGVPWDSVAPAPPTGLTVFSTTNDSIALTWEPNTEADLRGYYIYRSNTSNPDDWGEPLVTTLKGIEDYIDKNNITERTTYYYVVTAFDEVPNESGLSNIAMGTTLLGPHGPEVNNSIADIEMLEDTIDNTSINLYSWFKDINNDTLYFWCKGQKHITIKIYQDNGTVVLIPRKDWSGQETVTFFAYDGLDNVCDNVTITVIPVNDPPGPAIIQSLRNYQYQEFSNGILLYLTATCFDPDIPYGDVLTFKWSSNISGEFGVGDSLNDILLPPGDHLIMVNVTDLAGECAIATKNISILEDIEPPRNTTPSENVTVEPDKPSPPKSDQNIGIFIALALIILIIIIIVVFLIIRKKKFFEKLKKDKKPETQAQEATVTSGNLNASSSITQPQSIIPAKPPSIPKPAPGNPQIQKAQATSTIPIASPLQLPVSMANPVLPATSESSNKNHKSTNPTQNNNGKKLMSVFLIFALITLGFIGLVVFEGVQDTGGVEAATIIVDCSGWGNYKKIQDAINAACTGDTVHVWAGTYYENVVIGRSISLTGNHSSSTFIDGCEKSDGISIRADYVNVTGFTVTNCIGQIENEGESWTDNVFFGGISLNGDHVHIYKNIIAYNSHGIKFNWYGSNNTIESNLCYSNEYSGIRCIGDNNTIFNNTCSNGGGISCNGYSNKVFNNTCSGGGIGCGGKFNLITNNTCGGLGLSYSRENVLSNNICYSGNWDCVGIQESHNNLIFNNTINCDEFAMRFYNSDNNIVDHNIFNLKENGIICAGKSNVISNNTFRNGWYGIDIRSGSTTIVSNTMINNHRGIFLGSSQSAIIKNNKMVSCGIGLWDMDAHNYNKYIIDNSNTVNGKSIYFWKNVTGGTVPKGAGQIILLNCSRVTIENQNCSDSINGITIVFSNNISIRKNICNYNQDNGIFIWNSVSNSIVNNTCSKNEGSGISVGDWTGVCKDNYLENNVCIGNQVGISVSSSTGNYIVNNNCSKNQRSGIQTSGSKGDTLTNNRCDSNKLFGIYLDSSTQIALFDNSMLSCGLSIWGLLKNNWNTHNIVTSNTINGKPIYYWKNKNGGIVPSGAGQVILANCQNIIIQNQNVSHGSNGIQIGFSKNIIVRNNNCSYNLDCGISLTQLSSSKIENNTCNSNFIGIEFFWLSDSNTINNNNCNSNTLNGIYLYNSNSNIITKNLCNSNGRNGIFLYYECDNNIIKNNSIKFNEEGGIHLFRSLNNVFYSNKLLSCGFFVNGYDKQDFHTSIIGSNNTVNGKPVYYWKNRTGGTIPPDAGQVILANCSNINIMKQNLSYGSVGIEIVFSKNIDISNNICNQNTLYGIYIAESTLITIKNNTCNSNNKHGIFFKYTSCSNTIQNNLCNFNNYSGIYFYYYCSSNIITNNLCMSNKLNGLELDRDSDGNIIKNNTFTSNHKNGLSILDSDYNKISFRACPNNQN